MRAIAITLCFLTAWLCPVRSPAQVSAELYDLVYVSGGKIILGQIANLSGDPEIIGKIRDLQIGRTMRRTESRVVTVEEIKRAMPRAIEVYFCGAPAVEVRPQALPGEFCDILPLLQRRFSLLAGDSITVKIALLGQTDTMSPEGPLPVSYRLVGEPSLVFGKQIVSLERRDADEHIQRIHADIELNLFGRLAFTNRRVKRGELLSAQDLVIRTAELKPSNLRNLIFHSDRVLGWEAVRSLSANCSLSWRDLRPPSAIHEGDGVELIVHVGAAQIRAIATALQSGTPGERIWVRLDENGKRLQARVVEGGLVMLD